MAVVEIRCPNCGSPSVTKKGNVYCCNYCDTKFQIVDKPKKRTVSDVPTTPQIKYGKFGIAQESIQKLGNFTLTDIVVNFNVLYVSNLHAFKQLKRGDTIVKADMFGYIFTTPVDGKILHANLNENGYPKPDNLEQPLLRECVRIINDKATQDNPPPTPRDKVEPPRLISPDKLQKDAFTWAISNIVITKKYYVQAKGYDSGARTATITYKKKDFLEFGSVGYFAVPLFNLSYSHPNSNRVFKRQMLGYSGEIVQDDFKCSKTKRFGVCEEFPDNVCSVCGNLFCAEHSK